MGKHTPGPYASNWEACGGYDCITDAAIITAPDGTTVAVLDNRHAMAKLFGRINGCDSEENTAAQLTRENAARIVQCVNACEGIEDPGALLELLRDYLRLHATNGPDLDRLWEMRQRMRVLLRPATRRDSVFAVGSERPLGDPYLSAPRFALVTNSADVRCIVEDVLTPGELDNAGTPMADEVTGAVVDTRDGDYTEIWLSYSSRPYTLDAIYTRVR